MTRQEALQQLLAPFQQIANILHSYPEHADFPQGLNQIRLGMLLLKEGIELSDFSGVLPYDEYLAKLEQEAKEVQEKLADKPEEV